MAALRSRFLILALLATATALLAACGDDPATTTCDLDCSSPPAPVCDGDERVTYAVLGACVDNACEYPEQRRACADGCADGVCVGEADLCEGVTCESPPAPFCEGDTRVAFTPRGECDDATGECSYVRRRADCSEDGQICLDGECVDPGCSGVVCDTPPEPSCDDDVAITYGPLGACDEATGACDYSQRREDCAGIDRVCNEGVCVTRCDGVACDTPPEPFCEGDDAVRYDATGTCDAADGSCSYGEQRETCDTASEACVDGACIALCDADLCDTPPENTCDGVTALRYDESDGACVDNECAWEPERVDCGLLGTTCENGECLGLCDAVTCDTPPEPACDGDTVLTYTGAGTCRDGVCSYTAAREDCAATGRICSDGACDDPCVDVVCDTPDLPFCVDDSERVVYQTPGTCSAGTCFYTSTTQQCADFGLACVDGQCIDLCEGLTCTDGPADSCEGDFALDYPLVGTCGLTGCDYTPRRINCGALGETCVDGACTSLCEGVDCTALPAPTCDGDVRVTVTRPGLCDVGECVYDETRDDCTETGCLCFDGACVDPCEAVTCDAPPTPGCDGDVAVSFAAPGLCLDGDCEYVEQRDDCALRGERCIGGACTTLCDGRLCFSPPSNSCDGNTAVIWDFVGTCVAEGCEYTFTEEDCAASGLLCIGGSCAAPCGGDTCETPPPAFCDGTEVVSYVGPGVCEAPTCVYTEQRRDCADDRQLCRLGACFDPCLDVSCATPPLAVCEGNVRVRYAAPGTCDLGACSFDRLETNCASTGDVCVNGLCVDPCVTSDLCTTPPDATCRGDVAVSFAGPATCTGGACDWVETTDDCAARGEVCDAGSCSALCVGVSCDTPPAPACEGNVAVSSGARGLCELGVCLYPESRTDCTSIVALCVAGACEEIE